MTVSKPSVTKAFNSIIFKEMKQDGFIRLSSKVYFRSIDGEIVQFIHIHVETGLRRTYLIEYSTMLLSQIHESRNLSLGGRFTKGSSGQTYGAQNDQMLDLSIMRALCAYKEEVLPILNQENTVQLFTQSYGLMLEKKPPIMITGHDYFTLACAQALIQQYDIAKFNCEVAEREYKREYAENKGRTWALTGITQCEQLLASIDGNTCNALLASWREYSINVFKLSKYLIV